MWTLFKFFDRKQNHNTPPHSYAKWSDPSAPAWLGLKKLTRDGERRRVTGWLGGGLAPRTLPSLAHSLSVYPKELCLGGRLQTNWTSLRRGRATVSVFVLLLLLLLLLLQCYMVEWPVGVMHLLRSGTTPLPSHLSRCSLKNDPSTNVTFFRSDKTF